MHCHLAVRAAIKVPEAGSASRALSVPILKDGGTAKSKQMTARLVRFMAQLPLYVKRTTSLEARIEVQPLCVLHGGKFAERRGQPSLDFHGTKLA